MRAVAGSGKTTTLIQGLRYMPGVDLGRVSAGTFHSVGYRAVLKRLDGPAALRAQKVDGNKVKRLLREGLGDLEYEAYGDFVARLVDLAKGQGVGALVPDAEAVWYEMVQHHDLFLDDEGATEERAVELARRFLKASNDASRIGDIDFNDMLYLPLLWKLRLWQNDWVVVDEAQDTNPVRRALARLALRPGGRLLAVGDDRQAIYGFTGASHDALDLIRREFNCTELPLTISYRCPTSVGLKAQTIVDYFEVSPTAIAGTVADVSWDDAVKRLTAHDVVICRNTKPLIEAAFNLVARGVGCTVLGRDIGAGLVSLIKKRRASGIDSLQEKLQAYQDREIAKFTARGEEGKAEAVSDRVSCICTVIDHLSDAERTVPKLITKIEGMFSDSNGCLTLCTAHKSKGREWQKVAILRPDLMPSKWARQDWACRQEENLQYVAWTRSMDELLFIMGDAK